METDHIITWSLVVQHGGGGMAVGRSDAPMEGRGK